MNDIVILNQLTGTSTATIDSTEVVAEEDPIRISSDEEKSDESGFELSFGIVKNQGHADEYIAID